MIGGAAEHIGSNNINELYKVGTDSSPFRKIVMEKVFTSEDDAKKFEDESITKIGKEHIKYNFNEPYAHGKIQKTIEESTPAKWYERGKYKITKKTIEVPAKYSVQLFTDNYGKELAEELVTEKKELPDDMKYTISVQVAV